MLRAAVYRRDSDEQDTESHGQATRFDASGDAATEQAAADGGRRERGDQGPVEMRPACGRSGSQGRGAVDGDDEQGGADGDGHGERESEYERGDEDEPASDAEEAGDEPDDGRGDHDLGQRVGTRRPGGGG